MKFHRLVCLHVPTFRGDNSDGEGKAGAMGTGYQITDELIITSRHVVRPPNRQLNYRISCAWAFGPEGKKGIWTSNLSPEGNDPIVWENEGLDVALLRW